MSQTNYYRAVAVNAEGVPVFVGPAVESTGDACEDLVDLFRLDEDEWQRLWDHLEMRIDEKTGEPARNYLGAIACFVADANWTGVGDSVGSL